MCRVIYQNRKSPANFRLGYMEPKHFYKSFMLQCNFSSLSENVIETQKTKEKSILFGKLQRNECEEIFQMKQITHHL